MPGVPHQHFQQAELGRREIDFLVARRDAAIRQIEFDGSGGERRRRACDRTAADGVDTSQQLRQCERLDDVVVGSGFQPVDSFLDDIEATYGLASTR